ncbi:unnamed protein product [Zymoseptoria tritici ST99CH_1E4]|uniref:Uncharacterized protein n=1 Tax=Zymoseptoria tritici ST99CH_1E4 TaxID=1276532 RepID=A0A2H1H8B7_ZYMTR|nr:unnamed protein product [Zymoseptoria tritici ST99CH_1E4]
MQAALKVKDEERWAKEMKVWFADDNTVALRSVKYGSIKAGYFDHGAKEVYFRVGKNNKVIFAAKYPFESVKGLKECDSDQVTKKMMDVPDADEQALVMRFRDQHNGFFSAVRADEIVRPEVQLVFASPKCRSAAFGYAKRLGRNKHPLTPTSTITIEQVKAGTVLSTALAEKHGLDPYVFRMTAAPAAARLLRDYHSLPKWFTDEPAFVEGYIVMYHESVFAPGGRGRNKDNLNLVAMRGHPELFTEEGFANVSRSRDGLIVSTSEQLCCED